MKILILLSVLSFAGCTKASSATPSASTETVEHAITNQDAGYDQDIYDACIEDATDHLTSDDCYDLAVKGDQS